MKPVLISIASLLMLSSCCERSQRCGKVIDKWREGKYNTRPIVVIEVNGAMHKGQVDDITYAKATAGEETCIMLCEQ